MKPRLDDADADLMAERAERLLAIADEVDAELFPGSEALAQKIASGLNTQKPRKPPTEAALRRADEKTRAAQDRLKRSLEKYR